MYRLVCLGREFSLEGFQTSLPNNQTGENKTRQTNPPPVLYFRRRFNLVARFRIPPRSRRRVAAL